MKHTAACETQAKAWKEVADAFEKDHPNYCKKCGGWGYAVSPGCSVPYGSTNVSLPDEVDPCPACIETGHCPWCGRVAYARDETLEDAYCPHCGWEDGQSEGLPEEPECWCDD